MPFNPNEPQNGETVDADFLRGQFNDLNDRLLAAMAALDWSNGAPRLPDCSTIAHPVQGNLAFDYIHHGLCYFDGQQWQSLG